MTSEREPVDDAALIAEAYRNTAHTASDTVFGLEILRLERAGWKPPAPEPDRAEALACELWKLGETPILGEKEAIIRRHFDELRAEWESEQRGREAERKDAVAPSVYESAVKGRQDFRNAYRKLLPVLRAAEALSAKWRTKGQRVDSRDFFDAINAVDVAVTGGGATPIPFADLPEPERPVIDVPEDVVLWAQAQKDAKTGNAYVADFILQLARHSQ